MLANSAVPALQANNTQVKNEITSLTERFSAKIDDCPLVTDNKIPCFCLLMRLRKCSISLLPLQSKLAAAPPLDLLYIKAKTRLKPMCNSDTLKTGTSKSCW